MVVEENLLIVGERGEIAHFYVNKIAQRIQEFEDGFIYAVTCKDSESNQKTFNNEILKLRAWLPYLERNNVQALLIPELKNLNILQDWEKCKTEEYYKRVKPELERMCKDKKYAFNAAQLIDGKDDLHTALIAYTGLTTKSKMKLFKELNRDLRSVFKEDSVTLKTDNETIESYQKNMRFKAIFGTLLHAMYMLQTLDSSGPGGNPFLFHVSERTPLIRAIDHDPLSGESQMMQIVSSSTKMGAQLKKQNRMIFQNCPNNMAIKLEHHAYKIYKHQSEAIFFGSFLYGTPKITTLKDGKEYTYSISSKEKNKRESLSKSFARKFWQKVDFSIILES